MNNENNYLFVSIYILVASFWNILYRVSDKVVKKTTSNAFTKKASLTNHHSNTISPQPLQSERSYLHDKVLEKVKSRSPDKKEKEGLSLPELKGAEGKANLKQYFVSPFATVPMKVWVGR